MSKIGDALKSATHAVSSLVVEDDGVETQKAGPAPAKPVARPAASFSMGATPSFAPTSPSTSPFAIGGATVLDEAVYQKVLAKTNFDQTPVGQVIHKYYDALESTPLDVNTKFKTAIAQAQKLDGLTPDHILQAFDDLLSQLQKEGDNFQRAADGLTAREVTSRQTTLSQINDQINSLTQQIADLQTKHSQVSADLADAQTKVANGSTQFGLASQRRAQEIQQQKAQFQALLH
jgi:methyl-accepting chemotaxis protein